VFSRRWYGDAWCHMNADEILMDVEERMEKAADVFKRALGGIRTGRANPGLVDSLRVEVYGSPVALKQVASVGAPEPTQIVIRPFDPGTIKDIEKGIQSSDLGFNPQNDGRVIRINIPPLSTEVRRKLVARIKELGEEAKVTLRNVRRDGNKAAEQSEKDKDLTEDELESVKGEIQELTKRFENKIGDLAKAKETEVMED
jgi:ribosome recycling factor